MGSAILNSWYKFLPKKYTVCIVETSSSRRLSIKKKYKKYTVLSKIPKKWIGEYIFLAIKPQNFITAAEDINSCRIETNFFISIMAGLQTDYLKKKLKTSSNIVRIMPNIATEVGKGMTCIFTKNKLNNNNISQLNKIFSPMGEVEWIKKEFLVDAVTALSGSGPAYFFLIIQLMSKISEELGFNKAMSRKIILQTALGSLEMIKKEKDLDKLINYVASQGGTTEAALKIFSSGKNNLEEILKKGIFAAKNRSNELSKRLKI